MHTLVVILGGMLLLGLCLLVGHLTGVGLPRAALLFIPVWLIAAMINLWVGISRAGYSLAEEFPIFLVIFALPAAVAFFLWWWVARGG